MADIQEFNYSDFCAQWDNQSSNCQDELAIQEDNPLFEEYCYPSMFGDAEVFTVEDDSGTALRVLFVGGGFQSATYFGEQRFDLPFTYFKKFDVVFDILTNISSMLLIGGGAFSYPKHILVNHPEVSMDVVEIDPVIIMAGYKHFFIKDALAINKNMKPYACDGFDFLKQTRAEQYQVVVNDSFGGKALDSGLLSLEGLLESKRVLTEGGLYILNAVAEDDDGNQDEETLSKVRAVLLEAFAYVYELACEDEEFEGSINHIIVASDTFFEVPGFDRLR